MLCSRTNDSEQEDETGGRDEVAELGKPRRFSEPSSYARSYLSWDSVSFVAGELKKRVDSGLQWITYPSPRPSGTFINATSLDEVH